MERLIRLYEDFGQSPWLDNLKRGYLTSGELAELRDGGVRGLTSNPTIFQKAISGSADYDEQFRLLSADAGEVIDDYWALVDHDIKAACDVMQPVYEASDGRDGFVSVEVAPDLANDAVGTEAAARALHERIDRPNVMIKIPGTEAGLGPIAQMIAEGRDCQRHADLRARPLRRGHGGLHRRARAVRRRHVDADLSRIASVASFFISRVDTEVDRRLEEIGSPEALALRGKAAVAQAKLAYRMFRETFQGPRWDRLAARGAHVQRPLWASTSTKNPEFPDTLYVDELIGPDTVNTLPDATLAAFADHGTLLRRIDADVDQADAAWVQLADVGIDMDDVAERLEREGVASFEKSFDELLATLTDQSGRASRRVNRRA